jgi:hypothetical protein
MMAATPRSVVGALLAELVEHFAFRDLWPIPCGSGHVLLDPVCLSPGGFFGPGSVLADGDAGAAVTRPDEVARHKARDAPDHLLYLRPLPSIYDVRLHVLARHDRFDLANRRPVLAEDPQPNGE